MVTAAVRVEALEREVLGLPWGVLHCVGLEERHNVILDRDILAAPHRQMAQAVDARTQDAANQGNTGDGGVAQVQVGQAGAIGAYDALEQRIEGIHLREPVSVGTLVIAGGPRHGGRQRQAERQCLPCQRIAAQEVAQVSRRVVELKDRGRGDLG